MTKQHKGRSHVAAYHEELLYLKLKIELMKLWVGEMKMEMNWQTDADNNERLR